MLWVMRSFLANRVSPIIIIGLSGRWDRYFLQFLLGLARERELLIRRCKTGRSRRSPNRTVPLDYYPSVVTKGVAIEEQPAYVRVSLTADKFFEIMQL
jgi:hypothetical protein